MMIHPTYWAVLGMGLFHGLEPGHGWPVAALYALRQPRKYGSAFVSALVIAGAHFVSSIAVVVVYVLARQFTDFSAPWIKWVMAGVLLVLAARMWLAHGHSHGTGHSHAHEHGQEHGHEHRSDHGSHAEAPPPTLRSLAGIAFVLGFAHEEEFALLALIVSGVNPWIMMSTYALAVTASLVAITLVAVKAYEWAHHFTHRWEPHLPKITALVLVALAVLTIVG